MAKLTLIVADEPEVVIPLEGLVTLGRDEDNDVVIDDDRISRHHAIFVCYDDGRVEIRDMGSTAGTLINDEPIRSHFYQEGDRLALGPLNARITLEASNIDHAAISAGEHQLAELTQSIEHLSRQRSDLALALHESETTRSAAQQEIQNLLAQQKEEQSRLEKLSKESEQVELQLKDLRNQSAELEERNQSLKAQADKTEAEAYAAAEKLTHLTKEHQSAEEALNRVRAEISSSQHQKSELQIAFQQVQSELSAQQIALQETTSAENSARGLISELTAREQELRATLENLGPSIEKARDDLKEIEARLTPLRDWKASMDQRYERLGSMDKDSEEEIELWREIEEAQSALFDLLPAARIHTPRLTRGDFPRISNRSGVPLKSERIRRSS